MPMLRHSEVIAGAMMSAVRYNAALGADSGGDALQMFPCRRAAVTGDRLISHSCMSASSGCADSVSCSVSIYVAPKVSFKNLVCSSMISWLSWHLVPSGRSIVSALLSKF